MKISRSLLLCFTALLVTLPLLYLALNPVYIVHINIQPNILKGIQLTCKDIITQPDGNGVVYFDVRGNIQDRSLTKVQMLIRPYPENKRYPLSADFTVSDGYLIGTAQLGSSEWPVYKDEKYTFQIKTIDGVLLSEGNLLATVKPIAGGDRWLIIGIGLLASILQILSIFIHHKKVETI